MAGTGSVPAILASRQGPRCVGYPPVIQLCYPPVTCRRSAAMSHFKSNVRDLEFNLFEVFGTDQVLGVGPFAGLDEPTARGIIAEVARLAEGPLAASFAAADRNPPVFDPDTYTVRLPDEFKRSWQ